MKFLHLTALALPILLVLPARLCARGQTQDFEGNHFTAGSVALE